MSRWLKLKVELVTPCFLAGSQGSDTTDKELMQEGLRVPSLIGSWRSWLRAYLGARMPPNAMRRREDLLFGSQHGRDLFRHQEGPGIQARLRVRTSNTLNRNQVVSQGQEAGFGIPYDHFRAEGGSAVDSLGYLLGQGLYNFRDGTTRPAIKAGTSFEVEVTIGRTRGNEDNVTEAQLWADLRRTLWLWSNFGGVGSRSRRGWGSVQIMGIENVEAIADAAERQAWQEWFPSFETTTWNEQARSGLLNRLAEMARVSKENITQSILYSGPETDLDNPQSCDTPQGETAFAHLRSFVAVVPIRTAHNETWAEALADLANEMLAVRSNIDHKSEKVRSLPRLQDHDTVYQYTCGYTLDVAPYRAAFGLPHPYYFARSEAKALFNTRTGRRASPVLLHVAKVPGDTANRPRYVGRAIWFKARLVSGDRQEIIEERDRNRVIPFRNDKWAVVRMFLKGMSRVNAGMASGSKPPLVPEPVVRAPEKPAAILPFTLRPGDRYEATLVRLENGEWGALIRSNPQPVPLVSKEPITLDEGQRIEVEYPRDAKEYKVRFKKPLRS